MCKKGKVSFTQNENFHGERNVLLFSFCLSFSFLTYSTLNDSQHRSLSKNNLHTFSLHCFCILTDHHLLIVFLTRPLQKLMRVILVLCGLFTVKKKQNKQTMWTDSVILWRKSEGRSPPEDAHFFSPPNISQVTLNQFQMKAV